MKRTGRLRHRSKTNSRPWENLTFRRQYMDGVMWCEVQPLFPPSELFGKLPIMMADDPHHICGGANGSQRWDVLTNLIGVSRPVHDWLERYRPEGMVLCIKAKTDKGEYDDAAMKSVLGLTRPGASVFSYIRIRRMQFDWVQEILDGFPE